MREMKDSGVEWIGEIPKDWKLERLQWHLDEIVEKNDPIVTTQVLSLTNKKGVIPYEEKGAQGNVAKESYDGYKIAYPNTIVANSMNILIGSVGYSNYYGCVSPVYYVFKEKDNNDLRFINYIMQTSQFQKELRRYANGILEIRLRVSSGNILKRFCAFPDYQEQSRIADYLDSKCSQIDDIIEKQQTIIEKLKEYKLRLIQETVTKGLDENVELKESGEIWVGKVPIHWKVLKLKCHTRMITPMRDKPEDLNGDIPWVRIEDYNGKYIDSSREGFGVSEQTIKEMNLKVYPVGSILCTSSCDLGKCAIVATPLVSNQRFINIVPDEDTSSDYLYYVMTSNADRMNHLSTGTIQANLSRVAFEHLLIQFPPLEEQKEIASYLDYKVEIIDSSIMGKEKMVEKLREYKKTLIYEVVTGKKEV